MPTYLVKATATRWLKFSGNGQPESRKISIVADTLEAAASASRQALIDDGLEDVVVSVIADVECKEIRELLLAATEEIAARFTTNEGGK